MMVISPQPEALQEGKIMARLNLNPARPAYSVPAVPFVDMAIGYSVDELEDLTDRKVAPEGIDGDRLAMLIRARRGTARATGQPSEFDYVTEDAHDGLWGSVKPAAISGDRHMAAVGICDAKAIAYSTKRGEFGIPEWDIEDAEAVR